MVALVTRTEAVVARNRSEMNNSKGIALGLALLVTTGNNCHIAVSYTHLTLPTKA